MWNTRCSWYWLCVLLPRDVLHISEYCFALVGGPKVCYNLSRHFRQIGIIIGCRGLGEGRGGRGRGRSMLLVDRVTAAGYIRSKPSPPLQLAGSRHIVEQKWEACWLGRFQLQCPETAKTAAETDLWSDRLLGTQVLYHVYLSFIFILQPRYFFLSCCRRWREAMAGTWREIVSCALFRNASLES